MLTFNAMSGLNIIRNTTFANFDANKCGSRDYAVSTNPTVTKLFNCIIVNAQI